MASMLLAVSATLILHLLTQGQGIGPLSPISFGLLLSLLVFLAGSFRRPPHRQ
jgi:hypothetical protein